MSLRIVFMGTPEFAVPALATLVDHGYAVVGVVTATDKWGGRGKKQLIESPVKKYAVQQGIPVLQPRNLKDPDFQKALRELAANLQVVVAFRMLPEAVWAMPELGTFNLHGSLLPKYRGAAPINWAIIRGETETGVTSFFLQHDIDTGDMIFQESMHIGENDTAGDVHDRMMHLGAEVVLRTVQAIEAGTVRTSKQDDRQATSAPKIFRDTCRIRFDQPATDVHNFVRGLSPYPAAWTTLDGLIIKILRTEKTHQPAGQAPGTLHSDDKTYLQVACADDYLNILEVQAQGRRRMAIRDFLNGFTLAETSGKMA